MEIQAILDKHLKWLWGEDDGCRADLRRADLCGADLRRADLCRADLRGADLRGADLCRADLCEVNLRRADLRGADLRRADLRGADLCGADLREANLREANLCGADLRGADLSQARNLLDAVAYISSSFDHNDDGVIVYKTFGAYHAPPVNWEIRPGAILEEVVNPDRCTECGSGVNVATLQWVRQNNREQCKNSVIWKCLIRWPWLAGVVVPFNTDGKIRASKVELIEIVE